MNNLQILAYLRIVSAILLILSILYFGIRIISYIAKKRNNKNIDINQKKDEILSLLEGDQIQSEEYKREQEILKKIEKADIKLVSQTTEYIDTNGDNEIDIVISQSIYEEDNTTKTDESQIPTDTNENAENTKKSEDNQSKDIINNDIENKAENKNDQNEQNNKENKINISDIENNKKISQDIEHKNKIKRALDQIFYDIKLIKSRNDSSEYEKKINEGLAIDVDNYDLLNMLAEYYFDVGEYKKSLGIYKKLSDNHPDDDKIIYMTAMNYRSLGDIHTSEYIFTKLVELKPQNPKYILNLAEIKYSNNDVISAIELLQNLIKLRPKNMEYRQILAKIYFDQNDHNNYKRCLHEMLILDPYNIDLKNALSNSQ